ncbi:potassium-transporting ATPase subunit KdpC [Cellulomonas edaphi]|uniref:Potassium-transporting ATPase KdpC subunit n=1 Tax=Cellulomonas edaphi TaxID=3053468 RepID=A0ABT7S6T5_9CELL|nr:potassium-transporting ATPase subunit KdpC [Cellulomons edaphi]MDM7831327.1 potassium-transporting ATPase subunit KdpC [Cellulomons edaphi]
MAATGTLPTARPVGGLVLAFWRQGWAGLRVLLVLSVLLGVAYPLAMTGVGQALFAWQANGSLLTAAGARTSDRSQAVGSALIGQQFEGDAWFYPRPSVAGDGYDTLASAGSNLGPLSTDLLATVEERRAQVAAEDGVAPGRVPPDAVTASGSGLDPDISPAYARLQVARVAAARGVPAADVATIVDRLVVGRDLGVLGEPRVNVLRLNLALRTMGS